MQKIIVILNAVDPTHASWIMVDNAEHAHQPILHGNLSDLALHANDSEFIVIVPAENVLLLQANLPKLSQTRLQQALPYAVEDQLIDDVNNLHFASGAYQADNTYPVAVTTKQKMDEWLNPFKQFNISPSALIPATLTLPTQENTWYILERGTTAIVRTGQYSGFACDKNNLEPLLQAKLAEESHQNSIAMERLHLTEAQWLEKIASDISTLPTINLLQDTYQTKRKASHIKKIWEVAGYLAAAWIGLLILNHLVSFFILHHQVSKIDGEIAQIYKRNFPQAASVSAPRQRMEEKLKTISGQANKNAFLILLAKTGPAFAEVSGIRLQKLEYREKQIILNVTAAAFENLDSFTQALSQQGLTVKQQNVAISGAQVNATLAIRVGV